MSEGEAAGRSGGDDREIELKFEVPLRQAKTVRSHSALARAKCRTVEQTSIYFDTPKLRLHRDGFSLRVRDAGGKMVQTVKAGGQSAGLFDRSEWETPVKRLKPDLGALEHGPLARMKRRLGGLAEVSRSEVRRTIWLIDGDGREIELALDECVVHAAGRKIAFGEVEMELKQGPVESLFELARALSQSLELRIAVSSKSERGHDLAAGTHGRVRKAGAVQLGGEMNVAAAFATIILSCVRHFRLNEELVVGERDPAALHQARVAMRRLRAGLSLFGPAIRDGEFARLREEIRWFTGSLGDARNLDVFLKRYGGELRAAETRKVRAARARAYKVAIAAIGSQRLRDLFLDLIMWLECGEWRGGRKAAGPIRAFAERRLDRQWGRVHIGGSQLRMLDEEQLHRLRIDIKKMRYAVEFLGSLYRREDVKTFTSALEAIQETLGELNDEVTGRALADALAVRIKEVEAPAGGGAGAGAGAKRKQLASVARQFARLERAGLFWKMPKAE